MNIERQEANEMNQSGRDFLTVIKDIKNNDVQARIDAMQEGDFINMSGKKFKRWVSFLPTDKEALDRLEGVDEVKVEIIEIRNTEDEYGNKSNKLLVEGGGVRKEVHASLFYNYGHSGYKDIVFDRDVNFNEISGDRPDADIRK